MVKLCYMVSPIPGLDLSSKEIFLAKFSIVPGTWQLHMHSLQSECFEFLQYSDNCNLSIDLSTIHRNTSKFICFIEKNFNWFK